MLEALRDYVRGFRWPILLAMVALMTISVLAVRVAERVDPGIEGFSRKQLIFAIIGLAGFFAATLVHYQKVGRASYALFLGTLVLLVVVFLLPARQGSHRWISIPGVSAINLQPSEVAKLTFIIALAWYLRYRDSYRRLGGLIIPFLITLVPLVLILKEPDLGTAILLLPTLMVMLFVAGAKLWHLAVIVALGALVMLAPVPRPVDEAAFAQQVRDGRFTVRRLWKARFYSVNRAVDWRHWPQTPVAYCRFRIGEGAAYDLQPLPLRLVKGYQARRIEGWLRLSDPRVLGNEGFQQHHSMMILGSGRTTGAGRWDQVNTYFRVLPDDHTDFIYSVVGGQWGFVGCGSVLVLYAILFVFGADVAISTADPFGRLLVLGVLALLAAQIFINVGMTVGLMPVTGMTLPLVSYGGSSLVVNCMALGLLVNVGRRRVVSLAPRPFEFGPARPGGTRISPVLPERVIDGRRR